MKGKKKVKEAPGMNIPEIFAALSMLEKERGIPQTFMMDKIIQAVTTAYNEADGSVTVDLNGSVYTFGKKDVALCRLRVEF